MRKVVYNACYGGFSLSGEAIALGRKLSGDPTWDRDSYRLDHIKRHDPVLVQIVEQLGDAASGRFAALVVQEVSGPYRIQEYDGNEHIEQPEDIVWE